jgi:hypothetical protein
MGKKINISTEHSLNDLTSINKAIMPLTKQLLGKNGLIELEILKNWSAIVGKELALNSLPQKITFQKDKKTDGCLYISVNSGAFALEINQSAPQIIGKINVFFGYPAVSSLKIIQTSNASLSLKNKKNTVNMKKSLVSEQEEIYITELVKEIKSQELRETLERLGRAVFSNKQQQE